MSRAWHSPQGAPWHDVSDSDHNLGRWADGLRTPVLLGTNSIAPPLLHVAHDTPPPKGNEEGTLGSRRLDQLVHSVPVWPNSTPGASLLVRLTTEEGAQGDCQKRESTLFPPLGGYL